MNRCSQFLSFIILLFSIFAQAQLGTSLVEKSLDQVLADSRSSGKPAMVMVYASWCPHCGAMKKNVLPDETVKKSLSSFVVSGADAEKENGKAIMSRYKITAFPYFLFIDQNGELLYGLNGETDKKDFLHELSIAKDPSSQIPQLKKNFEADVKNPDAALAYIATLRKAGQDTDAAASAYFKAVPQAEWASAQNWRVFANGITKLDAPEFVYIIGKEKEFSAVSSEKRFRKKFEYAIGEALKPGAASGIPTDYLPEQKKALQLKHPIADSLVFIYDRQFYEKSKDWEGLQKNVGTKVRTYAWNNDYLLKQLCESYLANISDAAALKASVSWAERLVSLSPNKDNWLLLAKLQEKSGDVKSAGVSAKKAVDLATELGFDAKDASEYLQKLKTKS